MRTIQFALTVILVVLLAAAPASAKTIKVPGDFATPQAAIDAAVSGDKVLIQDDFVGTLTISRKSGITIQGKKNATLDANGNDNVLSIDNCSDITISGLEFRNSQDNGVIIWNSFDLTISKCRVNDTGGHGIAIGSSERITIEKSTFEDCGIDGINLDVDLTGTPPTDCVIAKNSVLRPDDDGIDVTGNGHTIEKNTVEDTTNNGILIDDSAPSSGVTIAKNKIEDTGEHGIRVDGTGHTIEKNQIRDAGDDGIRINGDSCTISKNKTYESEDDGIDVEGTGNTIDKNKISGPGGDGFDVDSDNNKIIGNKVTGAGDDGLEMEADNNIVEKNQFLKCVDHGIVVQEGAGNTFDKNKALKNTDDDIWTDVPVDDNTWGKNKYKTGNIEP